MNVVTRWKKRSRRRTSGSRLVTHLTLRIRVHAARANGREADFSSTSQRYQAKWLCGRGLETDDRGLVVLRERAQLQTVNTSVPPAVAELLVPIFDHVNGRGHGVAVFIRRGNRHKSFAVRENVVRW
jgi:hypothetical protein